jgi:phosphopentomutase
LRAIVSVLDSFGIGEAPDAARFGDVGANTFATLLQAGPLNVPNLLSLGLGLAAHEADPKVPALMRGAPCGLYGYAAEKSKGKDTPSGHWEMMGLPVETDWGYFPDTVPAFPAELTAALICEAKLPGILGDCHASGTVILDRFGEEHIRSGQPICYTSADSVFQIAAHEEHFGLDRLYEVCEIARKLVDPYRIGRVIARPFVGEQTGAFRRTANRHDIATPPHARTLLDVAKAQGREVWGIGKIFDIFAGSGLTKSTKAAGNDALFTATLENLRAAPDGSIVFANFVDFDQNYGHRRDVAGYARALEAFDARMPELFALLKPGDLAVFTADHGCDPAYPGTDHTREYVPVLACGHSVAPRNIGRRESFADIAQSLARHLRLPALPAGTSFLDAP